METGKQGRRATEEKAQGGGISGCSWGCARSRNPGVDSRLGFFFFFLKLPGDSTVQPRVRTTREEV